MDLPDNAGIVTCIYIVWARGRNLDLQILGCELHENAFCSRATPGPARGAAALPGPSSRYKEGRGRKWLGIGKEKKGRT